MQPPSSEVSYWALWCRFAGHRFVTVTIYMVDAFWYVKASIPAVRILAGAPAQEHFPGSSLRDTLLKMESCAGLL